MQEFSKYRMITAGIILMFIFAIAAIYTNTKDVTEKKIQNRIDTEQQQVVSESATSIQNSLQDITNQSVNSDNNDETNNKILQITERIDELERKVFAPQNEDDKSVRCVVRGVISDGHIIPLSSQEAVNESRANGKEVLITCVFK